MVDVTDDPALAARDRIVAVPTLVKRLPAPPRQLVGDLADVDRVRAGLDLGPPPSRRRPARRDPPTRGRRRRAGRRARPAPHPDPGAGQGTHRDPRGGRRRGGAGRPPWSPAVHAGQRRPAVPGDRRGDGRRRRHRLRARDHPLRQPAAGRSGRSRPRRAPRPGRHRARRRVRGGHALVPAGHDRARHHPPGRARARPRGRLRRAGARLGDRPGHRGRHRPVPRSSPTSPTGAAARRNSPAPTPS